MIRVPGCRYLLTMATPAARRDDRPNRIGPEGPVSIGGGLAQAASVLAGQPRANMVLLRGFATLPDWPRFPDVFRMRSLAIAAYPMYRGVARLVGMDAVGVEDDPAALVPALRERIDFADLPDRLPAPPFIGCTLHLGSWEVAGTAIGSGVWWIG